MTKRRSGVLIVLFASIVVLVLALAPRRPVDALRLMFFGPPQTKPTSPIVDPFLIELEERTFRFFWDTANPKNGLIPDRYPTPSYASIAAVGFGLTAYPIGVERHYITRAEARDRVLLTLRFFQRAANQHGFFYHFLDMKTGARANDSEVSTVDTALLLAGMLFCQS